MLEDVSKQPLESEVKNQNPKKIKTKAWSFLSFSSECLEDTEFDCPANLIKMIFRMSKDTPR